jgi:4-hydroxy-4-methyl-2-oxoglutarate aldolase
MQIKLPEEELHAIRTIDTCTLADAISISKIRLRNEGYSNASIRCILGNGGPMVGYAVTGRIRSAEPPMVGHSFIERQDWFKYIRTMPAPRIAVLQDVDGRQGAGAFWDEPHVRIHQRLGCVGAVTNGAVRDTSKIRPTGFHLYAGSLSVSQAYAHIIEVGQPVEVGGLEINPGDLIHGDVHGIIKVPKEIVSVLPKEAARVSFLRKQIAELCAAPELSISTLMEILKELAE